MVISIGLIGFLAVTTNFVLTWLGSNLERLVGISGSEGFALGVSAFILSGVTFALFYKILPGTKVAWRDVWLGAFIAAVLVRVATALAGLIVQHSALNSALQVAGAFSVLLISLNYIAQIFMLGAVACRVYANQFGSRRSILAHG